MTDLHWMIAPVVATMLAMGALGWFGLHVLQRGVIFVDLALAQVAALGATFAVFLGHDPDEPITFVLSLVFTFLGAALFSTLRQFEERVPQEALIGISYAVSAALGILLIELASDPHGAEKIQHLMVGNIVWVQWQEIAVAAAAIAVVGVLHGVFAPKLLRVSFEPEAAAREGMRLPLWDLFFYLTFGLVLTAIVSIVGVLLVFSFLVIPAVIARLFTKQIPARLGIAWLVGTIASVGGVSVSYEHSTGPIVVTILGTLLLASLLWVSVRLAARPALQAGRIGGGLAVIGLVLFGFSKVPSDHDHEAEHELAHAEPEALGPAASGDAAPVEAGAVDPLSALSAAVTKAKAGDPAGLVEMAALAGSEAPFIRMEVDDRLRKVALEGAPAWDPLAGPDAGGLWAAWAKAPPDGWQARASQLEAP